MDGCVKSTLLNPFQNLLAFPMPAIYGEPPPSAENIHLQPEIDPFYHGVRRFPTNDYSTLTPASSLEDLKGKVLLEAMNGYGCQFLHRKLQENKWEDIQMIFSEVKNHLYSMMLNDFGSYVIQKFFEVCDEEQMTQSVISITADARSLLAVCVDYRGSQSMQVLLECLVNAAQFSHILSAFRQIMVPLVQHPIGCFVIQRYLSIVPGEYMNPIFQEICSNIFKIATSQGGLCLLMFLYSDVFPVGTQTYITSGVIKYMQQLSRDHFGNHLVQRMIGNGVSGTNHLLLHYLGHAIDILSIDIYGSNIVRKLMKASNKKLKPEIITEIISTIISSPMFSSVLRDPYGKYVVESAKKYTTGTLSETLNHMILQHSDPLGKNALLRNRLQTARTRDGYVESTLLKPLPSAEYITFQQKIDLLNPDLNKFPKDDNNASVTVFSLEDLKGNILLKALDEYGHIFLLQKLEESKPEDIQMIFSEVKDHLHLLLLDCNGYCVAQKLVEVCDEEQMTHLVISVTADVHSFMDVCFEIEGSECMQDLLECVTTPEQLSHILSCFKQIMVPLVKDQNGSRVIHRCFSIFPAASTEPLLQVIAANFFEIATSQGGHCLHKLLISDVDVFPLPSQQRIFSSVMSYLAQLSMDQFGNHLVQHVIGLGVQDVIQDIVTRLRGAFVLLSINIYGSNVVRKLMKASKETYAPQIINEIIKSPNFLGVLQVPYGRYVVQSARKYAKETVRETLDSLIFQHSIKLHLPHPEKEVMRSKKRKMDKFDDLEIWLPFC